MKDFERIDRLRREWGDKYVEVDAGVPALRRFAGRIGRVMTINMNGHALVQFTGTNDIGWYDIDPASLRIVASPALDRQATAGPAKPKAPPRNVAEAAKENVRRASAEEVAATFADETVDSLAAESALDPVASTADGATSDDSVDSLAATEARPPKRSLSTEKILAQARQKKIPGAESEPGKNPPERRNSAPDVGEEET
ncbi:MAG TPA: hypothetical protein VGN57_01960 [Pirellulaceae bacterium]|jgi:hypothetical protein|nr:hypothetical protein [Pirellulaceae bacterium]